MLNQTLVRSPALRVLAIAAGIYAIYLPLAILLHRLVAAPQGTMVISLTSIQPSRYGGFAYEAPLPEFKRFEEYSGPNLVPSPILLYEDDKPLGPVVHEQLRAIASIGEGRFARWNRTGMIFSATDNSDPGNSGRKYWAVLP